MDEAYALATVQNHSWRQTYSALLPERFYDAAALIQRIALWERMLTTSDAGEAPAQTMRVAEVGGQRPAQLWVAAENARACRFYQRNGFVPDGEEILADDLEGLREVRMIR